MQDFKNHAIINNAEEPRRVHCAITDKSNSNESKRECSEQGVEEVCQTRQDLPDHRL
jgi:hypothetical protein